MTLRQNNYSGFQEQFIRRIVGFFPPAVTQTFEEWFEVPALGFRYLQTYQHSTESSTVIAIMEQADIPAVTDLGKEIQ